MTGPGLTYSMGNYQYDGAGNITFIGADSYVYNKRNMLTSSTVLGNPSTYTYDNFGNLTSAGTVDSTTNRLTGGATYDSQGNLTGFASKTYTYDPFSRQKSATSGTTTESYIYDAADERLARIQPSNTPWYVTLRDEKNELATEFTLTSSGYTRTKEYFHFGGVLAATEDMTTSTFRSWLSDHLGTPRRGVTISSNVEAHDYQPFGQEIGGSFGSEPLKFAKMERDSLTGNDNDHARLHLAGFGRFLSPDSKGGTILDPLSLNSYTYGATNPTRYVDADGRGPWLAVGVIGGATLINGAWRAGDYLIHQGADATLAGTAHEFYVGGAGGLAGSVAAVGAFMAGARNPYVIGGFSGEMASLAEQAADGKRIDVLRTVRDTILGAIVGKVALNQFALGGGRTPDYQTSRPFLDLFRKPNVSGVLKRDLATTFLANAADRTIVVFTNPNGNELPSGGAAAFGRFNPMAEGEAVITISTSTGNLGCGDPIFVGPCQ